MRDLPIPGGFGETGKAQARRLRDGWFDKYVHDPGLDIGPGADPLTYEFQEFDKSDGDATLLEGVPRGHFQTVYASHVLEHLDDPLLALRNWWDCVRPGGHLIVIVPHRDLFEKKTHLPSLWNPEHKVFFLPFKTELPHTLSFLGLLYLAIRDAVWSEFEFETRMEGYNGNAGIGPYGPYSTGEYSIEAVLRKPH